MSDIQNKPAFRFPISSVESDGQRFLGALQNEQYGQQVLDLLPPTFQQDLTAELEQVSKLAADHKTAQGAMHASTFKQAGLLEDYSLLAGVARETARATFTGNDPLLHSEFLIGGTLPRDLASVIAQGDLLVNACKTHAEPLALQGWAAKQTEALAAAVEALKGAKLEVHYASDSKEGLTGAKATAANALYRQCRAIQRVAQMVYPKKNAKADPSVIEARALFLLGEFPKRNRAARKSSDAGTPGPTTPTGNTGGTTTATPPAAGSTSP